MFLQSILNKILQCPLIILIHITLNRLPQPILLQHTQRLRAQKLPHQILHPNRRLPLRLSVLQALRCGNIVNDSAGNTFCE